MSSFMPWPRKTTIWECPKCGKEKWVTSGPPPWIMTCLPFVGGDCTPPICPKCKCKMKKKTTLIL